MSSVWFITGASSGFGKDLAELLLKDGKKVVLTARREEALKQIAAPYGSNALPLKLDVTDKAEREAALKKAISHFGHIDVLVNNAGAGIYGALEEYAEEQIRRNFELNFFAPVELSRAVLAHFRERKAGTIVNVTSVAGLVAFQGNGVYCASKFALEGFSDTLHQEVKPLGIKVLLVEPGAFRTDFAGSKPVKAAHKIEAYAQLDAAFDDYFRTQDHQQPGDPVKGMEILIKAVESSNTPTRLLLGTDAYALFDKLAIEARKKDIDEWREIGVTTDIPGAAPNPIG